MKTFFVLLIGALATISSHAQTLTDNGTIKYKMELEAEDPQVAQMFKDAGMEIGFLNGQFRMDMNTPMMRTRSYTVGDSNLVLMEMMGNKMKMMMHKDKMNQRKLDEKSYDVTETKETKTIAGYSATKYIVKTKDGQTYTVYTTDKLPMKLAEYSPYTKIKGAPLEYEMAQGPYKMKMTATEVNMGKETAELFKYDDTGYTRMSQEQMKAMMGGAQRQNPNNPSQDQK